MLPLLVNLIRDERSCCLSKDIFLHKTIVPTDLHTWGKVVGVFSQIMIKEGSSTLNAMRHFPTIPQMRENQILEVGFAEDILTRVEWMPIR